MNSAYTAVVRLPTTAAFPVTTAIIIVTRLETGKRLVSVSIFHVCVVSCRMVICEVILDEMLR